jgi:hypothetical protein
MEIHKITTIGRPLNFAYFTNKLIISIAFLTSIIFTIITFFNYFRGETNNISLITGIRAGLLVFLLWAISRELDPDKEWGAFVTVSLALAFIIIFEIPNILPFVWFLLILRIINHSSGMPAGIMDSFLGIAVGLILAYHISWIYGILTAFGFIFDSRLNDPAKYHLPIGTMMLIISAIIYIQNGGMIFAHSSRSISFVVFAIILFLPVIIWPGKLESVGDRTNEPLDPERIKIARIMAIFVFFGIWTIPEAQDTGIVQFIFCIFTGLGAYRIVSAILAKKRESPLM